MRMNELNSYKLVYLYVNLCSFSILSLLIVLFSWRKRSIICWILPFAVRASRIRSRWINPPRPIHCRESSWSRNPTPNCLLETCSFDRSTSETCLVFFVEQVHKVITGSIADRDGRVQRGDRILSINGRSLKGLTHCEAMNILKVRGNRIVLALETSNVSFAVFSTRAGHAFCVGKCLRVWGDDSWQVDGSWIFEYVQY